jgi:enolase
MGNPTIRNLDAWMIFDSRGVPSICAQVSAGEHEATAMVPSGASTGQFEALELRDHGPAFAGKGVDVAIKHIKEDIHSIVVGKPLDPVVLDRDMIDLDGTEDKCRLGANAILAVSIALWRLSAKCQGLSDFAHLQQHTQSELRLPVPMVNIINGGVHATNALNIQEFMIVPHGFDNFKSAISAVSEVIIQLKRHLKSTGQGLLVGDEGGFSLQGSDPAHVIELIYALIDQAGFEGKIGVALDLAASEYYDERKGYRPIDQWIDPEQYGALVNDWVKKYQLISVEDPFADHDQASWAAFMKNQPKCMVVGDDLFVTQAERLQKGIEQSLANAILIKLNQVGTVLETLDTIALAKKQGWPYIISHRSGDTEDPFIADLAVATGATMIKTGSIARSERVSKYNRLLEIEHCALKTGGLPYGAKD